MKIFFFLTLFTCRYDVFYLLHTSWPNNFGFLLLFCNPTMIGTKKMNSDSPDTNKESFIIVSCRQWCAELCIHQFIRARVKVRLVQHWTIKKEKETTTTSHHLQVFVSSSNEAEPFNRNFRDKS